MNCYICLLKMRKWFSSPSRKIDQFECEFCNINVMIDKNFVISPITIRYQGNYYAPGKFNRLMKLKAFW